MSEIEDVQPGSLSKKVLARVLEMMEGPNAMAPNYISEQIQELVEKEGYDEDVAERISSGAFELASALVNMPAEYL